MIFTHFAIPTLHILFRKKKFTEDHVTFFSLYRGGTHIAVVNCKMLLKSQVVKFKIKMVTLSDYFFEVAMNDVYFINLLAS